MHMHCFDFRRKGKVKFFIRDYSSFVTKPGYFGNILAALVGVQPGSGYETSCRPQEGVRDLPAQRGPYLVMKVNDFSEE